jgi:hypothetical protein
VQFEGKSPRRPHADYVDFEELAVALEYKDACTMLLDLKSKLTDQAIADKLGVALSTLRRRLADFGLTGKKKCA